MSRKSLTKLELKLQEIGTKEPSKKKHYYGVFTNEEGLTYVYDFDGTSPIFAKERFAEIEKEKELKLQKIGCYKV